jgi:alanyl-tRNA synthetase
VAEKVQRILKQQKDLEREYQALQVRIASGKTKDLISSVREVKGVRVLSTRVETKDPKSLRETADRLKDQIKSGIILLGAQGDGKVMLLCAVTPDLTGKYPAQKLVKEIAQIVGTGGGRADMAQAGGTKVERCRGAGKNTTSFNFSSFCFLLLFFPLLSFFFGDLFLQVLEERIDLFSRPASRYFFKISSKRAWAAL